ncbi:unnamed protein product [Gongylonema pulchrum]|uniref:Uncharacterized protein n=1 Tax=Gongylonema pulchrum TaxID=637853 RepID=A0A183DLA3_9BILA|nr:unnamed protein product [Gongylonema pulchrum]
MGDLMPLRSFLGNARILEYQRNFELLMNESFRDIFVKLYSTQIYYPIIDACYNEIFYKHYRAHKAVYKCPGQTFYFCLGLNKLSNDR